MPDIRTLFALITPDEIDASWVESVVPHELTHLVFHTAVDNPYHDPPHWLNEGLAVYLSDGLSATRIVSRSRPRRSDGTLIPLDGLAGAFPTSQRPVLPRLRGERRRPSTSIVRTYGRGRLVSSSARTPTASPTTRRSRRALGVDVAGFERDWLAELHADAAGAVGPAAGARRAAAGGLDRAAPNPSFDVLGTEPPQPPGAPRPRGVDDDPIARCWRPRRLLGVA